MAERIRPSATVVLHRGEGPDAEVFLVERAPNQRFFPGYHAFPGGTLDANETFEAAAVREVEEETGVRLDPAALVPAGRLLTPPFGPTRYDTRFFVARLPLGLEPKVEPGELVGGAWWRPQEAIAAWRRGALPLPPPTFALLRIVVAEGDVERAARKIASEDALPHHRRFRIYLHPGVSALPLRAPTLPPATTQNVYFFEGERDLYVVDPGTPYADERAILEEVTAALLAEGRRASGIILTHPHGDHVGAAGMLKERFGFPILAHPDTASALDGLVDREVADGETLDLGTDPGSGRPWRLRLLHTPGHHPGHVAVLDERFGAIAAGDLVSGVSTILVNPPEGDMRAYFATLERLANLPLAIVLPGHGPALPGKRAFVDTLAHRRMREGKVLDALRAGGGTIDVLLPKVYDDTPKEAYPLAARSLESHLLKLEADGRATRRGEAWSLSS